MNFTDQKTLYLVLGTAVISIAATYLFLYPRMSDVPRPETLTTTNQNAEEKEKVTAVTTVSPSAKNNPSGIPKGLDYSELLAQYGGHRIQFDNCVAIPSSLVIKNGSILMIDGLAPDPQIVTIGTKTVTLEGYEVAFVKVDQKDVPVTLDVDCNYLDSAQYNVLTLTVEP